MLIILFTKKLQKAHFYNPIVQEKVRCYNQTI